MATSRQKTTGSKSVAFVVVETVDCVCWVDVDFVVDEIVRVVEELLKLVLFDVELVLLLVLLDVVLKVVGTVVLIVLQVVLNRGRLQTADIPFSHILKEFVQLFPGGQSKMNLLRS